MNREIKFRAWDAANKCFDSTVAANLLMQLHEESEDVDVEYGKRFFLMQYTGLKDKNGKEIYEGDIVKEAKYIGGNFIETLYTNFEVIYHGVSFQYKPLSGSQYTISPIGCEVEVIGNIYEHPNLLNQPTH